MKLKKLLIRFLMPSLIITVYYLLKFGCKISPRAEVDLSKFLLIGKGTEIGSFCKVKALDGPLQIGKDSSIGSNSFISSDKGGVTIGDNVGIGPNAVIIGNNYKHDQLNVPIFLQDKTSKGITIGNNVWISSGCVILDGSIIGSGSIITPNSVVSGVVPENSIIQGNPGKVIFTRR